MRLLLLLPLCVMLGCQPANVAVDYDTQSPFTRFQYYSLEEKTITAEQPDVQPQQDALLDDRVKQAVLTQLSRSGIEPASDSNPADVLIRYMVFSELRSDSSDTHASIGVGGGRGNVGVGVGLGLRFPLGKNTPQKNVTIYVDMLDAKEKTLKWRGSNTVVLRDETPERIRKSIETAVAEIFSFYPPVPTPSPAQN